MIRILMKFFLLGYEKVRESEESATSQAHRYLLINFEDSSTM